MRKVFPLLLAALVAGCAAPAPRVGATDPAPSRAASNPPQPVVVYDAQSMSNLLHRLYPPITRETDATYTRIVGPWLAANGLAIPPDRDGLIVVYQPWGRVDRGALFLPAAANGVFTLADDRGTATNTTRRPLPPAEWQALRTVILDGQFFDLPYKSDAMGCDGASVYIEARIDGRQHAVCHWQPTAPVIQRLANRLSDSTNSCYYRLP